MVTRTRSRSRIKSNLLAVLMGVGFAIALWLLAEIVLFAFGVNKLPYERKYDFPYYTFNEFGVSHATPGVHPASSVIKQTGDVIYEVAYSIDEFGRRITPATRVHERDKFLLFFGGSYTFGEGVHDSETLPYYAGALAEDRMPYNYGFHDDGLYDALAKIDTSNFVEQVKEQEGALIYTFIDDHLARTIGVMSKLAWQWRRPYYEFTQDGTLLRNGSFVSAQPFHTLPMQ